MKYMLVFFVLLTFTILFESRKKRITKKVKNEEHTEQWSDSGRLRACEIELNNLKKSYEELQKKLDSATKGQISWATQAQACFKERDACKASCPPQAK